MNDKEFEINDETPIFNSWENPETESNKVYAKSFPGQVSVDKQNVTSNSIENEPVFQTDNVDDHFEAPEIDFTTVMPKVEEPVSKPFFPTDERLVNTQNIDVVEKENIAPSFVKQDDVTETPMFGSTVEEPVTINSNVESVEKPISQPIEQQNFNMPETMNNQQVDIKSEASEQPPLNANVADDIQTMTPAEMQSSFKAIIDDEDMLKDVVRKSGETINLDTLPTNGEMVEGYNESSDNTFSSIFTKGEELSNLPEDPKMSSLEADPGIPSMEDRAELIPPSNVNEYRPITKRRLPEGFVLGGFIFLTLFIFTLFLEEISQFVGKYIDLF